MSDERNAAPFAAPGTAGPLAHTRQRAQSGAQQREAAEREVSQRPAVWQPASLLPSPKPQAGWRFKWVRRTLMGQLDATNFDKALRSHWVPVAAADCPELLHLVEITAQHKDKNVSGFIEIGGLVLCKMPEDVARLRDAHFKQATINQAESVEANLAKQEDKRMPLFRESNTSVGRFGGG